MPIKLTAAKKVVDDSICHARALYSDRRRARGACIVPLSSKLVIRGPCPILVSVTVLAGPLLMLKLMLKTITANYFPEKCDSKIPKLPPMREFGSLYFLIRHISLVRTALIAYGHTDFNIWS
jgi:hypothetical protein